MRISITKIGYCLFTLLFLLACGEEKSPTSSGDLIDEEKLDGSISGTVFDTDTVGLEGIAITLSPGGATSTSDFAGNYTIPKVEEGVYSILFDGGVTYSDTILTNIQLAEDQELKGIDAVLRDTLNSDISDKIEEEFEKRIDGLISRDITGIMSGTLDELSKVSTVEVVAKDASGAVVPNGVASISNAGQKYAVTMGVPEEGGTLEVFAMDEDGRIIGYATDVFDGNDAEITIAEFNPTNAIPKPVSFYEFSDALYQYQVTPNDKILINLNLKDADTVYAGYIDSVWIKLNDGDYSLVVDSIKELTTPSTTGMFYWQVKVKDNDGNIAEQAVDSIEVIEDLPTGEISGGVYFATNENASFVVSATDLLGEIKTITWTSKYGTVINQLDSAVDIRWSAITEDTVSATIIDDDLNEVEVKFRISVNKIRDYLIDSRDNNKYDVVYHGSNIWMAENLKYTGVDGSFCPDDLPVNCENYEALYNFAGSHNINQSYNSTKFDYTNYLNFQGICPTGWRLPSWSDFNDVKNSGGTVGAVGLNFGSTYIKRTDGVYVSNFTITGSHGQNGSYWGALGNSETKAFPAFSPLSGEFSKEFGLPVRCIKN